MFQRLRRFLDLFNYSSLDYIDKIHDRLDEVQEMIYRIKNPKCICPIVFIPDDETGRSLYIDMLDPENECSIHKISV